MKNGKSAGKVIVITGASSGFGKGVARRFGSLGASVVVAARRKNLLEELAVECEKAGGRALAMETDVSQRIEVQRLAQTAIDEFGRIDVWINCAGVGAMGPLERVPLEDHARVIETTLLGTVYGSYYAYKQFLLQKSGTLVNIASELGANTVPYFSSYAAAKHGVVGFDDSLRQEVVARKLKDIHVCTVLPTAHDTPFFDHAGLYTGHEMTTPDPLHDPNNVVDAVVALVDNPKDKKIVGADGIVKILMKNLAPTFAEWIAAKQTHATFIEKPPPAADDPGAVQRPVAKGTEVQAGRRKAS
jgi:short-subunit dehydrogenase